MIRDWLNDNKATPMAPIPRNDRTTDPKLLERVRDWQDSPAWARFVSQYDPRLRAVCRFYGLIGDSADDCCQHVWINLASTMRRFCYDPGRRFRYWLRSYFHSRVKDVLKASPHRSTEAQLNEHLVFETVQLDCDDDEPFDSEILAMLHRAREVQDAVRARVTPENWEVFRLVGIEGRPVAETAMLLGRQYTTVYRSFMRVSRMISDECRRRSIPAEG